ncbi:FecR family protein [Pseudoflavitalea rhizosphaerae]|uniref:FecR family protein n=1 Tax=Pseudoflavitalea rhizosphaerae TaxID=1884793 RepID=UPI000F8D7C2E|nr:FecR domain-containing protein [Pseudoflavitalea rhizosphaerae]
MSQHTNHQVNDQLLAKYLSGEAAPEEAILVETWLTDPDNNNRFRQVSTMWTALSGETPHQLPDQEIAWQELHPAMISNKPVAGKWKTGIIYKISIAAGLFFFIATALYFLVFHQTTKQDEVITQMITRKANLQLLHDTLPDGSSLVLNSGASIIYPKEFTGTTRRLQLQGEAWFNIQQRPNWPFIIQAGPVQVKILGTSFNILENKDSIVVSLASGAVRLCAGPDSLTLQPGQQGIYDIAARRFTLASKYNHNQTGYATRVFDFHNASLEEIAARISKAYGINIIFNNKALATCTMSSTFENQSIDYIMNVIAATLNIEYRIENNKIYLSGNSCE